MSRDSHVRDEPGNVPIQRLFNRILRVNVGKIHCDVHVVLVGEGERTLHTPVFRRFFTRRVVLDHVPETHHVVDVEIPKGLDLGIFKSQCFCKFHSRRY